MTEYEITIKVTEQELEDAQYGSVGSMVRVLDKVVEEAKKKGYVPSN